MWGKMQEIFCNTYIFIIQLFLALWESLNWFTFLTLHQPSNQSTRNSECKTFSQRYFKRKNILRLAIAGHFFLDIVANKFQFLKKWNFLNDMWVPSGHCYPTFGMFGHPWKKYGSQCILHLKIPRTKYMYVLYIVLYLVNVNDKINVTLQGTSVSFGF